jgi:hypothetical protein|tara:strand:- start:45 stop:206 length:162 start_codon:yes stop_codon:yes gene_type:complete
MNLYLAKIHGEQSPSDVAPIRMKSDIIFCLNTMSMGGIHINSYFYNAVNKCQN